MIPLQTLAPVRNRDFNSALIATPPASMKASGGASDKTVLGDLANGTRDHLPMWPLEIGTPFQLHTRKFARPYRNRARCNFWAPYPAFGSSRLKMPDVAVAPGAIDHRR
jgi:hypothetical protein